MDSATQICLMFIKHKSTLAQLLLALLAPTNGSIELYSDQKTHDQVVGDKKVMPDASSVMPDSDRASVPVSPATRCNFMYVPQGNSLLSGSVRANLLMARPGASEEELRDALHVAAADFVLELPDGLDTSCAEIGRGLSEGQAQRIAIARALLRPGGILILDEATSALDPATEQLVLERIRERYCLAPVTGATSGSPSSGPILSKTIICITHRPAAAALADSHLAL